MVYECIFFPLLKESNGIKRIRQKGWFFWEGGGRFQNIFLRIANHFVFFFFHNGI